LERSPISSGGRGPCPCRSLTLSVLRSSWVLDIHHHTNRHHRANAGDDDAATTAREHAPQLLSARLHVAFDKHGAQARLLTSEVTNARASLCRAWAAARAPTSEVVRLLKSVLVAAPPAAAASDALERTAARLARRLEVVRGLEVRDALAARLRLLEDVLTDPSLLHAPDTAARLGEAGVPMPPDLDPLRGGLGGHDGAHSGAAAQVLQATSQVRVATAAELGRISTALIQRARQYESEHGEELHHRGERVLVALQARRVGC